MTMNRARARRTGGLVAVGALLAPLGLVAASSPAAAAAAMVTDCESWPQETFYRNQPVCVTGDLDYVPPGHILPAADIYVTANVVWNAGDRAVDVTGSPNHFQSYGTFYDEYAWLPTLAAGRYDILVDNDLNGTWDPAHDILLGSGVDYAFDVLGQDLAGYSFDSAGVKAQAQAQVGGWRTLSAAPVVYAAASSVSPGVHVTKLARFSGYSWKISLGAGGVTTAGAFGLSFLDFLPPVGYGDWVLSTGTEIIHQLSATQAAHYQSLADAPADPAYGQATALNMAEVNAELATRLAPSGLTDTYPFPVAGTSTATARQSRIATLSAEQAALTSAITHANERYLGAQAADDVRWAVLHAQELAQFTAQLATNQQELVTLLQAARDDVATVPGASDTVDASALEDFKQRIATTGFTPEEIAGYESMGYTPTDAQDLKDRIADLAVPNTDTSLLGAYDAEIAITTELLDAYEDAAAQAAALATTLQTAVETVAVPAITLSSPSQPATAGSPTTLTASTSGGTGALTVRWDLDLDGAFDDATGTTTAFTPTAASDRLIGARVSDTHGMSSTAYLRLVSNQATQPAEFTTQSPAGARIIETGGTATTFSVAAVDPDAASVTYQWYLDDTPVGTGSSYTYGSSIGERSLHVVSVEASDGDATHPSPEVRWVVTTLP
jgi:hypothetical protein